LPGWLFGAKGENVFSLANLKAKPVDVVLNLLSWNGSSWDRCPLLFEVADSSPRKLQRLITIQARSSEQAVIPYGSCGERFKDGKVEAMVYIAGSQEALYLTDTVRKGDPLLCNIPECRE
jgi:hypothetical protein